MLNSIKSLFINKAKEEKLASIRLHCLATKLVLNNKNIDTNNNELYIAMVKETLQ